ncbi:lysophospholipid acyltransferase family protein [Streptoalloteichus hindustanus]|uniref:1-acyl-sn-glycerol-3-phosphate acyltransferase n=1 Tax=Streptoalloteichus hindustanus TaxID=2017 RepID=A0A1M5LGI3_STRHI|nr:lysophospholipid acyltransferase family protein [Streptoalloteichus hindustanus]SHG63483.1 1-acyl-sn-glycerol-3-phosphate acyltransferase [Streptoalloteichus hindustanus]
MTRAGQAVPAASPAGPRGVAAAGPDLPPDAWPWLHDLARWIGTWWYRPFFRLRVRGRHRVPRGVPVVLVANHSAFVDGPFLYGVVGRRAVFLIKREIFRGPLGWALRRIGQLPVRRGEPDRTSLLAAVRVLRAGGLVGVFPEGTRGDGAVSDAENGAAWLARSAGALVLPVACRGTLRPADGRRRFRPRVDVLVGEPFALPADKGRTALRAATERLRGELAALVAELDRQRGEGVPSVTDGPTTDRPGGARARVSRDSQRGERA